MSRLAKNEIFKQYKKLHQEDLEQQRLQAADAQSVTGDGSGDDEFNHDGDDDVDHETEAPPSMQVAPKEVVQDVDEFDDVGGSGNQHASATTPGGTENGYKPVAVPPAVARATSGRASPRGGGFNRTVPSSAPTVQAGEPASATSVVPVAPRSAKPAPPPRDGSEDEDEFPTVDDLSPSVQGGASLAAPSKSAYVSPMEQLRREQAALAAEQKAETVSSSTNDEADTSSSSSGGDEDDGVDGEASRGLEQPTALSHKQDVHSSKLASTAGKTVPGESAPKPGRGDEAVMAADAEHPNVGSPPEEALGAANSIYNVSNTSVDDPTSLVTGTQRQGRASVRPGVGEASSESIEGALPAAAAPPQVDPRSTIGSKRDGQLGVVPGGTGGVAPQEKPPRSPSSVAGTADGTPRVPLTPVGVAAAVAKAVAEKGSSDEDDEPLERRPRGADDRIAFWPAAVALFADKQVWTPYAPAAVEGTASQPSKTVRKKSFSLFSCCGGGHKDVVDGDRAPSLAVARSAADLPDADFVLSLRAMPLSRRHVTQERVLQTVYWGLVARTADRGAAAKGSGSKAAVSWEKVGFQGADPATDLRASGFLGLLSALYVTDRYPLLTEKLWRLCNPLDYATEEEKRGISGNNNVDLPFVLLLFNFLGVVFDLVQRQGKARLVSVSAHNRSSCYSASPATPAVATAFVPISPGDANAVDEQTLRNFPFLHAVCECLVGVVEIFFESWMQLRKARRPALPFVGDFGAQKSKVHDAVVSASNGLEFALRSAMKARSAEKLEGVEAASK